MASKKQIAESPVAWIVIRMRGISGVRYDINHALGLLRLSRSYSATVIRFDASSKGVIHKISNYVAYGPADAASIALLLSKRGKITASRPLKVEDLAKAGYKTFEEAAEALASGKITLGELAKQTGMRPIFSLRPPVKGVSSTKLAYPRGVLGKNKDIAVLLKKMI